VKHGARQVAAGLDMHGLAGQHYFPPLAFVVSAQLHQGKVWDTAIDVEQHNTGHGRNITLAPELFVSFGLFSGRAPANPCPLSFVLFSPVLLSGRHTTEGSRYHCLE
jgi:hypothetical protein